MTADAGLLLAKHMDADDQRFASRLSAPPQRLLAMFTLESNRQRRSRPCLVLLSDLRLYVAPRKALRGRYVKFNIALNDVVEVAVLRRASGFYVVIVSFMQTVQQLQRVALVAQDLLQIEFVQLLVESGQLLNVGRAQRDRMRWHLPEGFLGEDSPPTDPHPSAWRSALILQYRAFCDALRIPVHDGVVNAFLNEAVDVFDPLRMLGTERPSIPDLKALCLAVRNCTRFTSIKVEGGSALSDDSIACVALALGVQHDIRSVTISEVGFGRIGVEALATALAAHEGPDPIQGLSLFGAQIGPGSMRALSLSLPASLQSLDLADCHLNAKSIVQLCQALGPTTLQRLNVSRAACGRVGSAALAEFLSRASALQELIAIESQLDTVFVVDAIVENRALPLRALNLAGNRLPKSACLFLAEYLSRAHALAELVLCEVKTAAADLDIVLCASVNNQIRSSSQSAVKLDLSGCEIGAYALFSMVQRRLKVMQSRLHVLDLSDCKLGYAGLANILSVALNIESLQTLIVSGNARATIFNKGVVELRDVLAQIARHAALRHLVLDEDGGGGGPGLPSAVFIPMFETLSLTSGLQYLSVAGHQINEATFLILAGALRTNRGLIYLNLDRNHSTLRSVTALADSIRYNDTLCHVLMAEDLARLQQRSSSLTAPTIETISASIRTRTQLNRRRRHGEAEHDYDPDAPITFACRDLRLQRRAHQQLRRRRQSVAVVPDPVDGGGDGACPQFGMDVSAYEIVPCPGYEPGLPRVLLQLQALVLAQQGLQTEGIFRVAPDAHLQAEVKKALDNGADPTLLQPSAACGANLLKIWFRHLPNRILAPAIDLFTGAEVPLADVLARLGDRSRAILLWLLDLCAMVSIHTAQNKMSPRSLAIVFAPNLIHDQLPSSGDDPIEALRRSQEVARSMEAWIAERIERHMLPEPDDPNGHDREAVVDPNSAADPSHESASAAVVVAAPEPGQFHSMPRTLRLHYQRANMMDQGEVHTIR